MNVRFTRKVAVSVGAAVAALAVFGGGVALGYVVNGSGSSPADDSASSAMPRSGPPGPSMGENRPPGVRIGFPQFGNSRGNFDADGTYATEDRPAYPADYHRCSAPVGDVLSSGGVNLADAGFATNLLDGGFALTGMSVRSEGECDDNGRASSGSLVLDTSWIHSETGLDVWVSQRASSEPVANVMYNEGATFWADGYEYSAWVSTHRYYPMTEERAAAGMDTPATSGTDRAPASEADPRIPGVVAHVVAQLAPSIGEQCFHHQQEGSWEDLAAMGLGDPRGAIPAGFTEAYFDSRSFAPPAEGCPGADLEVHTGESFSASFSDASGDGWLNISAWRGDRSVVDYPGWSDPWSVSWMSNGWQISVNGSRDGSGLGVEALTAIGRALDAGIDEACFIQDRELNVDELDALGFRQPVAPDGYAIDSSSLRVTEAPADCDGVDESGLPSYSLSWSIAGPSATYEASVQRSPAGGIQPDGPVSTGHISDRGMNWTGADGDVYGIWVDSPGDDGAGDRDVMTAIALSLDPDLDISTLTEETGGGGSSPGQPRALPQPADGIEPAEDVDPTDD